MAYRQYIGARYVVAFDGTWDATKNYEPLTVVDDANGNSYTSKKDVPAGTPLTDRTYWQQTASFSGAVTQLQNRMSDAESNITTLQGSVSDLQTGLNDIQTEVDDLKAEKNVVLIFGDSWAGGDPNISMNDVIAEKLNVTVKNYAQSGTGFDVPNGYDEQITTAAADTSFDHSKIKYVLLVCGLNDHARGVTSAEFAAMLTDWYNKLATAFTLDGVKIFWFQNYSIENTATDTNPTTYYRQCIYYKEVETAAAVPIVRIPLFGLVSSWRNYRHPDAQGHADLAENMVRVISGVPVQKYKYCTITATIAGTATYRTMTLDYYVSDLDETFLDLVITADNAGLANAGSPSAAITFDRSVPARLPGLVSVGMGCVIASGATYTGGYIVKRGDGSWSADATGATVSRFLVN